MNPTSNIVGREKEVAELRTLYESGKAEFVAIYGRRRIGKTFLVDEALKGLITFRHAGLSPIDEGNQKNNLKDQLKHFYYSFLYKTKMISLAKVTKTRDFAFSS